MADIRLERVHLRPGIFEDRPRGQPSRHTVADEEYAKRKIAKAAAVGVP